MSRPSTVLTTAYSYRRTKDIIKWAQLKPIYLDSSEETFSLHPECLDQYLKLSHDKVGAVLAQHAMVKILDYKRIEKVCEKYGVPLIFDSVEVTSPGSSAPYVGRNGNFEAFSLHPSKVINACEGGVITCNSSKEALKFSKFLENCGYYDGYFNLPISHAEFGKACLLDYSFWVDIFRKQNKTYENFFSRVNEIEFVKYDPSSWDPNYKTSLVDIKTNKFRDYLIDELAKYGIPVRRMYHPFSVPEMKNFPVAQELSERLCFLPVGETVERTGQHHILERLDEVINRYE